MDEQQSGRVSLSDQYNYASFADEVMATYIISDPWVEGDERFRLQPVILTQTEYRSFVRAIESVGRAWNEMIGMLYQDEDLLDRSFYLTPWQRRMWIASGGAWHGIARADAFLLADGSVRICELNADTPSGEPEAVILNHLRHPFHPDLFNPNEEFEKKFIAMVLSSWHATLGLERDEEPGRKPVIGIIYPTDIPEDLSMIELYRGWMQSRGWQVHLGSPYNLSRREDGRITLFGNRIDIIIRHYKTDWWGEREPILVNDEEYLDPDPLEEPLRAILGADVDGQITVVNPFGAILAQNKLSMAFLHREIDRFTSGSQEAIRRYIPYTQRLCDADIGRLRGEKDRWVLKSDFGCEGDEVVIGPLATEEYWESILEQALPERWIAQEYFRAAPRSNEPENEAIPNYGLFLIGGSSGGIFTRFSSTSTDYRALTPPTFVEQPDRD